MREVVSSFTVVSQWLKRLERQRYFPEKKIYLRVKEEVFVSFPFRGIIFREGNMREVVPSFTVASQWLKRLERQRYFPEKEDLSMCKGRSVWFEVVFA
ncbi:hypothetical protein CEXT_73481 [Caerostris extrusa]|uniref:Uncharacterized protein n=1 Tax=Caerostris extrusa TaxID=172846 RepID=A0AAV4N7A3_CAEEX|nr:hypothetical protein CEXT_73481 [Caerostris extrusa]